MPFSTSYDKAIKQLNKFNNNQNYYLLVAKQDNVILGTVLGIICEGLAENFMVIEDVIVKEQARGTGIGTKIMNELDKIAKINHCAYAILVSSGFRKKAHSFYTKVGFTDDVVGFRKIYN